MKIKKLIINNFRAFKYAEINFDDFNCIIGKNDTGKSTILAALDWFFDSKKDLNNNDFAAAGFDWTEFNEPSFSDEFNDMIIPEKNSKEYIFDDFYVSVELYLSDVFIPKRSEQYDYVFDKDYLNEEGYVRIIKYMYHPLSNYGKGSIYSIIAYQFKKMGKTLSDCSFEELKKAYSEIGENAEPLCNTLKLLKEKQKGKTGFGLSAIISRIRDEEARIKEQMCNVIYNYYNSNGEKKEEQCVRLDNNEGQTSPFHLELPIYKLYTSKTRIEDYLNALFTPFNASQVYKSIEKAKVHTTKKISEILNLEGINDNLDIKENEKIDLFTQDSLVFKHKDLPLHIPLKNRGEGLQLKIKNAVFMLLTEIQTKKQINTIFAFEEPESHLHPSAQLEMYNTIKALSESSNYQVIITTHSPFIVKELAKDKIEPIVVRQKAGCCESEIGKQNESVLPYISMNEYIYIAFDEPTIEYHIELFGYLQNKLNKNVSELDEWLKKITTNEDLFDWYDTRKLEKEKRTLPYCVRNNINHPLADDVNNSKEGRHDAYLNNNKFNNKDLIGKSIEIMRNAIISYNKTKNVN